ncbi:MAG TPA: SRPBCC domain-containing protein [Pirellulales bacterium]|nr:SRPBCC domain-containing protein [Pirellulales bacterium]
MIDAAPERLFEMYLDSASHAAFTGQPVTVEPRAGGAFRAFDGVLSGTILHVEPKRLIVQTWRSKNFPPAARDSVLMLSFLSQQDGARIEVAQIDVPEEDLAGVSEGWEKFYWMPLRAYLAAHPAP